MLFKRNSGKAVPITLLTGYLGAGKTTLLNNILRDPQGHKIAVIVNDIGEVNIDAELIAKGGAIEQEDDGTLVPLSNGCICCTLKKDLMDQIETLIKKGKFLPGSSWLSGLPRGCTAYSTCPICIRSWASGSNPCFSRSSTGMTLRSIRIPLR